MTDEQRIRELVRRVVYRTVGREDPSECALESGSRLITERDIQRVRVGGSVRVAPDALVTPLARQAALERRVRVERSSASSPPTAASDHGRTIALGADHAGFALKNSLADLVASMGFEVIDCGTGTSDPVDYPDFAGAVAELVSTGQAMRGIVVDGAGIGSCMVANKVPGVRAALCYDEATAVNSREHNHANVLTLGAGLIGAELARKIVTTWLETPAGGGRHQRRVDKITAIERRFARAAGERP